MLHVGSPFPYLFTRVVMTPSLFSTHIVNNKLDQMSSTQASVLKKHVKTLSELDRSSEEGRQKVMGYIVDKLTKNKIKKAQIEFQEYEVEGIGHQNILVHFGTKKEKGEEWPKYIVGAHYDRSDKLPGADDNASGVAGLLELARMLNALELNDRNIDLVFYDTKAAPHLEVQNRGSYVHAKSLEEDFEVQLVLILDMIGFFLEDESSQSYPSSFLKYFYPKTGNFIALASNFSNIFKTRALAAQFKMALQVNQLIEVRALSGPGFIRNLDLSTPSHYWNFGIPAIMATDTGPYRNKKHHTIEDAHETLDYKKMKEVVDATFLTVLSL